MKRLLNGIFCITLLLCLLSASGQAQTGATPSSPINAGNFGPGGGSFNDTRNSSSSGNTTYINSIGQPSPEVYYRFVVSAPVTIDFSLCQSNFDTYIHILNASASEITYQDDSEDCGTRSHLAYSFTSSGTYYLAVEGYGSNTGTIVLSMNVMATGGTSPNISYPSASITAAVGTAVSIVPTNNGGAVPAEVQASTMSGSNTLNNPLGTATDSQGNVYVADAGNQRILKITAAGGVSTLAGSGSEGSADGTGTAASFKHPSALTVDATGNVYVSDQQNHRIRKITPGGVVSTLAGSGSAGYANGNGNAASFSSPIGLALDGQGNLYVADYSNHRIRKIELSTGNVSTYAGNGAAGLTDGSASSASFRNPMGLCADAQGNLYVADRLNHAVRKIATNGTVSTLAGNGSSGYADGNGNSASFNQVNGVALAGDGNLYVADLQNNMIRKVSLQGVVSTFAGNASAGTVNGLGSAIRFSSPYGLSARGNSLYVAQTGSYAVRWLQWGSYTITPALPAGLALNSITGEITGTPATLSPVTSYTVTAANGSGSSSFTFTLAVAGTSNSSNSNYNAVYTYIPRTALDDEASLPGSSIANVNRQVQYFDGLGRLMQNINVGASPTGKDVVQPIAYDEFGREAIKYLPYTSSAGTPGAYRSDALKGSSGYDNSAQKNFYAPSAGDHVATGFPVSISNYESSPLSRVIEQGAPGEVWQPGQGHTVKIEYTGHFYQGQQDGDIRRYEAIINTTAGQQHLRSLTENGTLSYNTLFLTITKDENWSESDGRAGCSYEYKDKEGHVVLKRSFNKMPGGTLQTLSTYYVYDDLGDLCFVLPPGANPDGGIPDATALDNFCYQYRYDSRNRLIEKKLPGKSWEEMIYNPLDQVVFTQDAVQRAGAIRSFVKYDAMGRTVMTGIEIGHHGSRAEVQGTVNTLVPYWETRDNTATNYHGYNNLSCPSYVPNLRPYVVNYYDNYNIPGLPDNQSSSYSNKTRGLLTAAKTLVLGTTDTYLWTVNYYDEDGRIARSWQQHYKGGVVSASSYDQNTFEYNFAGEIVSSTRKHYVAGTQKLYVYNEYGYDHTGRKISAKQRTGDNDATTNPLVYLSKDSYNEIGQQLAKGLHSTDEGASFAQTVKYRYNPRGWLSVQAAPLFTQELKYELDSTGLVPQYNGNISQQKWGTNTVVNKQYTYTYDRMNRLLSAQSHDGNDESITYSEMGNITSLQRKSLAATVDQLTYSYTGNRLNSVADANANTSGSFQLTGTTSYGYDANGNMNSRTNATNAANNLSNMDYNHLNLPTNINANGAVITYIYDANGTKLKKLVTGNANVNNEYISGIQYEDGDLKYVATETGRVRRISATSYSYEHTLTDHLGNGRVYFDISGGVARKIQETDYYAFGLDIQRNVVGVENKFQYNGKEKQDQEKMYDYGARFYDPVIGRWNVVDALANKDVQINKSPYAYAWNNPINLIDPDGNCPDHPCDGSCGMSMSREIGFIGFDITKGFKELPQKLLSFTDINDATVIATTITRGSGAINIDETPATTVDKVSSVLGAVIPFVAGSALKKGAVYLGERLFGSYGTLRGTVKDAHHIIQDAAVRDLPGYKTVDGPAIHLEGPSTTAGTPHNLATVTQRERRALGDGGNFKSEMNIGYRALRAAGLSPADAKEAIRRSNSYFNSINVTPNTTTRFPYTRK
ncbi:hypothetical protein FFJ24_010310 [Pedobacter sp. KBS0701]|uniref:DUF6443 domain-containing protein n=1 Tax=Pedobacter sp. KBS0701 TaxID=2578106 RepID=UPI00110E161B|nr:DUF6443 domain-containing protein [Pedobacter sp. KBS0701]QDW25181.1 hypothetical protein FFJ24_010310 [Pedobacter sp. KBS0701]